LKVILRVRILIVFFLLFIMMGCRQGMYNQPKAKPLRKNPLFQDQTSARPLALHTVARGNLEEDEAFYVGKIGDRLIENIPIPITGETLTRGKERYSIYCSVCHAETGEGNGMVVQRGFPQPPSFHIDRLRKVPAGHIFDVISHGYGVMYPYRNRINARDRWCIVAYIKVLQLSRNASVDDLTPEDLKELNNL
jgi:hypothetical protein